MKRNTIIYLLVAGALYWYWMRRKKQGKPMFQSQTSQAGNDARSLMAQAIDQTTFTPDLTTFKDQYQKDINACK